MHCALEVLLLALCRLSATAFGLQPQPVIVDGSAADGGCEAPTPGDCDAAACDIGYCEGRYVRYRSYSTAIGAAVDRTAKSCQCLNEPLCAFDITGSVYGIGSFYFYSWSALSAQNDTNNLYFDGIAQDRQYSVLLAF